MRPSWSMRFAGSATANASSTRQSSPGSPAADAKKDPLADLTGREREVLSLLAEGLSNTAISRLSVAERTVEAHTTQIFRKLGLDADPGSHRRVLAVLAFLRSPA